MKNAKTSYARSLIEASLDPLVTISADGKIMDVYSATEKVTGVPRQELIGSDFSNYFTDPQKTRGEVLTKTAQMTSRYRGEEFVVVVTEIEPDKIVQRLDALRLEIERLSIKFGNHQLPQVTVSIGVAIYPTHAGNRLELLNRADQSLLSPRKPAVTG